MQAGEQEAWRILAGLAPEEVCARTLADFDRKREAYRLGVFNRTALVSPSEKIIQGVSPRDELLFDRLHEYVALSILGYLIHAKDILPSGRLIKPSSMKGGRIYVSGAHMLPLDRIGGRYGRDREGFLAQGRELGGEPLPHGDAAIRLFPFPRVAVAVLLWIGDEEFGPRADLLMDATCEFQLPPDILWMTAMMCALAMLTPLPPAVEDRQSS